MQSRVLQRRPLARYFVAGHLYSVAVCSMALEFRAMMVPTTAKHNFVSFASPLDLIRLLTSLSGRPLAIKYCCRINT